jgi:hypothetical protein
LGERRSERGWERGGVRGLGERRSERVGREEE